MTRPKSYLKIGGHGRPNAATPVREVTTIPCPGGGLHVLVNDARGRTECVGCSTSWAELDGVINARGGSWLR